MQLLVISTFRSEMQRPSAEKLWQMPILTVLPVMPALEPLLEPLEVQATSYLAESERMVSLSIKFMGVTSLLAFIITQNKCSCHLSCMGVLVEYEKTFVKKGLTLFFDRGILLLAPNKKA
jgi:hypothetical protein